MTKSQNKLRASKEIAIALVRRSTHDYSELLHELRVNQDGWLIWPEKFIELKERLAIRGYVQLYEDENKLNKILCLALFSPEELQQQKHIESQLSDIEKQEMVDSYALELSNSNFEELSWLIDPDETPDEIKEEQKAIFEALTDVEQKAITQKIQCLYSSIICTLNNYLSVMVNGEKITSLVPKAIAGNDDAFFKAVKIDRNLISDHPYFSERIAKAHSFTEKSFLKKLSTQQTSPNLTSKIRYPALYFIFSMLEVMDWLDDFTHSEILDLCDLCGLDRWQNSIGDVNAVTKQLLRYRNNQRSGRLSMQ